MKLRALQTSNWKDEKDAKAQQQINLRDMREMYLSIPAKHRLTFIQMVRLMNYCFEEMSLAEFQGCVIERWRITTKTPGEL